MSVQACLLIYDIPERSGIPNPSRRLRSMAVRINLSCWVIPQGDIPYALLNGMAERGATWHCVKFDANEGERLVAMAIDSIKRDIRLTLDRARTSSARVNRRLDVAADTVEGQDAIDAHTRARKDASQVVSRLRRMLRDYEAVATRFGITRDQLGLSAAMNATNAIGAGMKERARLFGRAIRELEGHSGADDGMVQAMKRDDVHHGVAADYMEDRGMHQTAESLRSFSMSEFGFEL